TYDHRILRTRLPVRSAIYKQDTGGLVLRWVTTGEYLLLYVFAVFFVKFLCGFFCACTRHKPSIKDVSRVKKPSRAVGRQRDKVQAHSSIVD
ncbi:hypothetical protein CC80DRAFT_402106, partial [Byssothecium circinans]